MASYAEVYIRHRDQMRLDSYTVYLYAALNMPHSNQHSHASTEYDYIIAGAGCAGLSLLIRILQTPNLQYKKILLVDKVPKNKNDRTWCFWESESGLFESIVKHRWNEVNFFSTFFSSTLTLKPYQYKMIEGTDFYQYCFDIIARHHNVTVQYANITAIENESNKAVVIADGIKYTASYVFSSIIQHKAFLYQPLLNPNVKGMLQHFKGWVIETKTALFNPAVATFMDFRVSQQHGTTFMYVMPMSTTKALVEYTLFTPTLLQTSDYDNALKDYIATTIGTTEFTIQHEEFGIIPMTAYRFSTNDKNIIYIGTAGGKVKASSGYAFTSIQRHSQKIVERLQRQQHPAIAETLADKKFFFFDRILLHVLLSKKLNGDTIFGLIFKHNAPETVFRFLDNRSNLLEDLQIMRSVPTSIFLPAAMKEMLGKQ